MRESPAPWRFPSVTTFRSPPLSRPWSGTMRLMDAIGRVEPTWVEAVAVVQAVCAQIGPGQAPPDLGGIMLSKSGAVSFPPIRGG